MSVLSIKGGVLNHFFDNIVDHNLLSALILNHLDLFSDIALYLRKYLLPKLYWIPFSNNIFCSAKVSFYLCMLFKPFSFCFILHKNVLCRLEIDRLSWHDPSDSNTIFLRWMSLTVNSRKNLWLQNFIQNEF